MTGSGADGVARAFSRRLVLGLMALLGLFVAAFVGTLLWLTQEHDELAEASEHLLIARGVESRADALEGAAIDYSYWDQAATRVAERDATWIAENMASSVGNGPFDALVIVHPDGAEFGWRAGGQSGWGQSGWGQSEPRRGALPAPVVERMVSARRSAYGLRTARMDAAVLDGEVWQLAAAHVAPQNRVLSQAEARAAPIAIYGKRLTPEDAAAIGAEAFIEGVALVVDPPEDPAFDALALRDATGAPVAHLSWPHPAPGTAILRRLAAPIAAILLGLVAITLSIVRHVVRSARRLERALDDAQAADRAKSEFLTTISHELRTPMNGVIGVAQLLEDTPLDEEQAELVAILGASAEGQMALIEELLAFGEIEAGRVRLREEVVDPAALLAEALGAARVAAAGKGLGLRVSAPADAPLVLADAQRLRQIVVNLAGNAVKFTDRGHVEVSMAFEPQGGDAILMRLSVADTGPGIAPGEHERIFERFTQGDGSTRRAKGGTGLGLAISRALGSRARWAATSRSRAPSARARPSP